MAKGIVNAPTKTSGFATKEELKKISMTPGPAGVGIVKVEQTVTSADAGGTNEITVTLSNNNTFTFFVKNGPAGPKGDAGKSAYELAKDAGYDGTEEDLAAAFVDMKKASAIVKQTVTLGTDWAEQEDGTFAQTVEVEGVTGNDAQPIWADCALTREDIDADIAVLEAWSCVNTSEPIEGKLTFYCYGDVPSISIPVKVVVSV